MAGYRGMAVQADTRLMDSRDKRHISTLLPPLLPPWSRGEDGQPWGHTGLSQHSGLAATGGIRQRQGSAPAARGQAGCWGTATQRDARPARTSVLFEAGELRSRRRRGFGRSALLLCGRPHNKRIGFPPSSTWLSLPSALPVERQPSRQAPTISRPPQPNLIVPGRCLLPPPHLSLLFLANSPPPPGSSRSHNSILFMETNCPAGGCT